MEVTEHGSQRLSPTDVSYNQKSFWNQWSRPLLLTEQDLYSTSMLALYL